MTPVEIPLIPDPDASDEMGFESSTRTIADEDLRGSRLLIHNSNSEPTEIKGQKGGLVEITCNFHPAHRSRFSWIQLSLELIDPSDAQIIDLAPEEIKEAEPVTFTVNNEGKIGAKYAGLNSELKSGEEVNYAIYHCSVLGSGQSTNRAVWTFKENPVSQEGIYGKQVLLITLPHQGKVKGNLRVNARLIRPGLQGGIDAIRDLILGTKDRVFELDIDIPEASRGGLFDRLVDLVD
ncbi:MAG: hypothetical protein AAGA10_21485 [Bacteroidota bacterium]